MYVTMSKAATSCTYTLRTGAPFQALVMFRILSSSLQTSSVACSAIAHAALAQLLIHASRGSYVSVLNIPAAAENIMQPQICIR